jgi:phenylpyruvate tautomerase PptA (4-oxalocrotonate tautomerase family)
MPLVKIELATGRDMQTLITIRDLVTKAVIETLQLLPNDSNIRVMEYAPELFQMKPPYEILVEISMFSGRTKETKTKLYKTIVDNLDKNGIIEKEKVFILLNELPKENWGVRGGIPADEIELGFKVEI